MPPWVISASSPDGFLTGSLASDHSLGHELAVAAVAMGARVIEKHVTLDRLDPELAEHHFALEPSEFAELVSWMRTLESNLDDAVWRRSPQETAARRKYRRSFHYTADLPVGHLLQQSDVVFIRPGTEPTTDC